MGTITRNIAHNLTTGLGGVGGVNFRNIIINGDMSIAQRATSKASITTDGYYTCDRWNLGIGSFGTWRQSQESDGPAGTGLTNALKMDCTTAQGSPAASSSMLLEYSIEGQHLQEICQGTANAKQTTLSFWHKHTKTGINTVELLDADNNNAVSGSYTQSVSNTWEKATITFPAHTSGAYGNDNARSLRIRFAIAKGTDLTSGTLATTWQTSITNANRHAGQVNNADSTSNNFIITGVQYEIGATATDFEHVPNEITLGRCYRYFFKLQGTGAYMNFGMTATSGTNSLMFMTLPTAMRNTPTISSSGTFSSNVPYSGSYENTTGGPSIGDFGGNLARVTFTTSTSYSAGLNGRILLLAQATGFIAFDAEL